MKKLFTLFLSFLFLIINILPSSASFLAGESKIPEKKETSISKMNVEQILALTPKTYEELTGEKMSFKDKIALRYVQKNIKRELKKNGKVDLRDYIDGDSMRFNIGGFALGLLLGLIGVGLAHIFSNSKSFRRSSWYGLGALVIILLIVALTRGGSTY